MSAFLYSLSNTCRQLFWNGHGLSDKKGDVSSYICFRMSIVAELRIVASIYSIHPKAITDSEMSMVGQHGLWCQMVYCILEWNQTKTIHTTMLVGKYLAPNFATDFQLKRTRNPNNFMSHDSQGESSSFLQFHPSDVLLCVSLLITISLYDIG